VNYLEKEACRSFKKIVECLLGNKRRPDNKDILHNVLELFNPLEH